jgi:hypothetical protein
MSGTAKAGWSTPRHGFDWELVWVGYAGSAGRGRDIKDETTRRDGWSERIARRGGPQCIAAQRDIRPGLARVRACLAAEC